MRPLTRHGPILVADDDPDDRLLIEHAFRSVGGAQSLVFVEDGEELLDYLLARGLWAGRSPARPILVLLDLNMPRKDGREALAEMKAHPVLRSIPVVVLTTSSAPEDVRRAYDLGANSYLSKPGGFDALLEVMRALRAWWLGAVTLPGD